LSESFPLIISESIKARVPSLFVATRLIRMQFKIPRSAALEEQKAALIREWAGMTEEQVDKHPLIIVYRELGRQIGGDQKLMPAVESLYKRGILQGRFPMVNAPVDTANLVSARHFIPIGLFDFDKIKGEIELTVAKAGDSFLPIGKEKLVALTPGTPILRDSLGIFSAIGTRDSQRTMITAASQNLLAVSWGGNGVNSALVEAVLDTCALELLE
jgi:DNA/RNA-binding domain of Phe-tRNA-synthetase-like protein